MRRARAPRPFLFDVSRVNDLMRHRWVTRALLDDVLHEDDVDTRLALMAARQGGAISCEQAHLLGATEREIRTRRERSYWRDLHTNVFVVGATTRRGRAIGALLAAGVKAVLSHITAATLQDLYDDLERVHVTGGRRLATLAHHSSRSLNAKDITSRDHLRVTTPERTALDCAEILPRHETTKLIREGRVNGKIAIHKLEALCANSPGRHGVKVVRHILASPDGAPTRSWGERRLLQLIADAGLPKPDPNHGIEGKERDIVFTQQRLILEIDDYATHGDPASFERDRSRDAALLAAGWRTLRVTTTQIRDEPLWVIATLAAALRG